jgi:superfamily II DNA/RNA helicase
MALRSFFLRANKKVEQNRDIYKERAQETKQHSARLVDMQRYVDMSEEKRALLFQMLYEPCPDDTSITMLERGVVVYVKYLDVIAQLDKDLTDKGIDHLVITGKVSQSKRGEIVNTFRGDATNKVIIVSDAASESISLHSTNILYMYNCPGSPGRANQVWGRVSRFGSVFKNFYIFYVICDETIDKYMPILLSSKKELEEAILHADYIDLKEEAKSFDSRILKEIRKEVLWKTKRRKGKN